MGRVGETAGRLGETGNGDKDLGGRAERLAHLLIFVSGILGSRTFGLLLFENLYI